MKSSRQLILSCEHATNQVPLCYASLFAAQQAILQSHQGFDAGSLSLAKYLHEHIPSQFTQASVTRLLIDCNRSLKHQTCFSIFTKGLATIEKEAIIHEFYTPYRQEIMDYIQQSLTQQSAVIHLSIHSFTPVLNNQVRQAELGLLYDPKRRLEKQFANLWRTAIHQALPNYRIRMNYPYKGISDGLTTSLRRSYSEKDYLGIEVEVNQKIVQNQALFAQLKSALVSSLLPLLNKIETH